MTNRRVVVVKTMRTCLVKPSHARLIKSKISDNPGEFVCGLDDKCRKEHIIRLARIHRVHRNLRLYWCNRIDCSKALLKVDATNAKEEYTFTSAPIR